ncbi:hypothetical protein LEP48_01305 [Isoptericola sp. NEAU-Y5]|uniref:Uncharacterized protein n=1 Tax=Isoptericola luteus TaxID=2879484 RepID=A0ABS7ZC00_9MICO|nr:hypothetical protein [Isoptericola sp. NEAU-Y5]MCA5891987.1 hypothetical protein [Isoptericola sp. NEAU-Y5]
MAAAQSTAAPWWGVPAIAGSFLIVGGALGFWFNWILEGRRQGRSEAIRWDGDIRQYVAELVGVVETLIKERSRRGAFTKGMVWVLEQKLGEATEVVIGHNLTADPSEEMRKLIRDTVNTSRAESPIYKKSEKRSRAAWERAFTLTASISLVASRDICDALDNLITTASRVLNFDDHEDLSSDEIKKIRKAVNRLVDEARRHLGLQGLEDIEPQR